MSERALAPVNLDALVEQVVVGGDLSKLSPRDRLNYYRAVCESVGLNPLTRPLEYLYLSGKMVLYARKDATDQLRKKHNVSILPDVKTEVIADGSIYVVTVFAKDATGREDNEVGAVSIGGLKGETLSNAIMKAHTKAKRRVTLSICGLGMLDETEVGNIPDARPAKIDYETGEVLDSAGGVKEAFPKAGEGGPIVPALDEMLERSILNEKITKLYATLKYRGDVPAKLWAEHVGGDPREADLAKLTDFEAYLRGLVGTSAT